MAHMKPLNRDKVDDPELQKMYRLYESIRGFIPNSVLTMSRRPNIAKCFGALNKAILYEGTVSEELKMLVSLVASQASGCRYCQSHMANLSSIYQASDEKIAKVWECETSGLFTDAERAALRLAMKAGTLPNDASQEDFSALKKHFDAGQIVEIVATISLFGYLNRWNDTMATQLEEYPAKVAERIIGPGGWNAGKHEKR